MLAENLNNWRAAADLLFKTREYIEITTAGTSSSSATRSSAGNPLRA